MTTRNIGDPDPETIVSQHWPAGARPTPELVVTAVETAAKLLRYANQATITAPMAPADIACAVDSLRILVGRLPQLCEQLGRALHNHATTPGLYDQRGADPAATARGAANRLRGHTGLVGLVEHLTTAAKILGEVAGDTTHLGQHP